MGFRDQSVTEAPMLSFIKAADVLIYWGRKGQNDVTKIVV